MMFEPDRILYEDNHLLIVNKRAGELVQPDPSGDPALEDQLKAFIRQRDAKPGRVFLGVVHRIDRPVSGVVIFAKTSKALARLNEMIKNREIAKYYWAITEARPQATEGSLRHYLVRDGKTNKSKVYDKEVAGSKEARLNYRLLAASDRYYLLEVELLTGRHHQIRAQLSKIGCPIRGDLKYGAARSNRDGSISLHARRVEFLHPVATAGTARQPIVVTAPVPQDDNLWRYFEETLRCCETGSPKKKEARPPFFVSRCVEVFRSESVPEGGEGEENSHRKRRIAKSTGRRETEKREKERLTPC